MPANLIEDAIVPIGTDGKEIQLSDWEDHEFMRNDIFNKVKSAMEKQFAEKTHNGVRLNISDI